MVIDRLERKILHELQRDGRITTQELAERVGLSTSPCWRRVKDLEAAGVIKRYTAVVDRFRVGLPSCMWLQVNLTRHQEGVVEGFEKAIAARSEVVECYELTGDADYLLKVLTPDIEAYNAFLHGFLFKLPGVAHAKTSVSLREVKYETTVPL
jgi:DNA-binding Lrp family transcriptional regulator